MWFDYEPQDLKVKLDFTVSGGILCLNKIFMYIVMWIQFSWKTFVISNEKFLWISFKHIWACFTFTVSTTTVSISHIFSTYVSTTFFSITTITSIVVSTTTSTTPPPRPPSPLWYPQPPLPRPSSSYPHPHVLQKLWQNHPFQKIIPNLHPETTSIIFLTK